jgi:hypothetical protein
MRETEALGMKNDHIYLLCGVFPKIAQWEIVLIFKKYNCQGDIAKVRLPRSKKKSYGVVNFGLMNIMLSLLLKEESGPKWKIIYKNKANQRKAWNR